MQQMTLTRILLLLLGIVEAESVIAQRDVIQGDTMTTNRTLADGQILVSAGRTFALGFFSPASSSCRYLGIWYYDLPVQIVVWVANRASPLSSSSGMLKLAADGNIILFCNSSGVLWSSGTSNVINPILQLLDSGNLVLASDSSKLVLWQSFDHPGDTYLPGMKIGTDFKNNLSRHLTSWKSSTDPSPGDYYYKIEAGQVPEVFIWKGSTKLYRSGPSYGKPYVSTNSNFSLEVVSDQHEIYHSIRYVNMHGRARVVLDATGVLRGTVWSDERNQWTVLAALPSDPCDNYGNCGTNTICAATYSPVCQCVRGFTIRSPKNWNDGNYSDGCARKVALSCPSDNFLKLQSVKLPDTANVTVDSTKIHGNCTNWCLKNCSCIAFATDGGDGCLTWYGDLKDIRTLQGGNDLFVRLAASELVTIRDNTSTIGKAGKKNTSVLKIILPVIGFVVLVGSLLVYLRRRGRHRGLTSTYSQGNSLRSVAESKEQEVELPLFSKLALEAATDDFSSNNLLGEGGFGPVYKGQLEGEQEIAVKRLSKHSVQGLDEFKTEISLIAKLQHRNLVRLLGCCIEDDERMLIYEFMQNTSLDSYIFDKKKLISLDWRKRLDIIIGIARGLLYLHQESRLKIIHRDLKTSNILLDQDMNPKISDFGMARILKEDQIEESTRRVVGTYGYMAPEYAMYGKFSEKSDIFSFGVIVLEVLSGKRNRVVTQANHPLNLLGHAWTLWKNSGSLELLEKAIGLPHNKSEVLRFLQVGLLCVQEKSENRPTMGEVILMLASESAVLTQPEQPGVCMSLTYKEPDNSTSNRLTMTVLEGR